MNSASLDVVLPTFNNESTIKSAVESVLNQSFSDFQLIIVNDASTDGTLDVVQSIVDPRISIITNSQNLGCGGSKNVGLTSSSAPFVTFVDGDDTIFPYRFEMQMSYMRKHQECSVLGTQMTSLTNGRKSNLPLLNWEIRSYLYHRNCLAMPTIMLRRESFDKNMFTSLFNPRNRSCEDYELFLELLKDRSIKFRTLNVSTVLYDDDISEETSSSRSTVSERIRQEHLNSNWPHLLDRNSPFSREQMTYFFARLLTKVRGIIV